MFPFDISLTKAFLILSTSLRAFIFGLIRRRWMVKSSCTNSSMSPALQDAMRLSRQATWSLDFERRLGFCGNNTHMVMAAFRATDSRAEPTAYARKRRESSHAKAVPAFPEGMAKMFLLQCTTME